MMKTCYICKKEVEDLMGHLLFKNEDSICPEERGFHGRTRLFNLIKELHDDMDIENVKNKSVK